MKHFYGKSGEYQGHENSGEFFDANNHYAGTRDVCGDRFYGPNAEYLGSKSEDGSLFNERNEYQGRVIDGWVYDKNNSFLGIIQED